MQSTERLSAAIAAAGFLSGAVAWALAGLEMGTGALVGAAVVYGNWLGLRWLLQRFVRPGSRKGPLVALLLLKMLAIFVVCWLVIVRFQVDGLGFALGLTALPVGLVIGAAFEQQRSSLVNPETRETPRDMSPRPRAKEG